MNNNSPIPSNINVQEIVRKGEEIYNQTLKTTLEPFSNGKYVAIEVDSKKYFLGETKDEAALEARKEFPDKVFYIRRIGEIEKIASYYPSYSSYLNAYDWLF